jgi:hypothetical protein
MPSRYLHYDEKTINESYLKNKGIEINNGTTETDLVLEPKICTRCKELYPNEQSKWLHKPSAKYCTCGQVLDKDEIQTMEALQGQAQEFTQMLLQQTPSSTDLNKGFDEALYQTMVNNPLLLEKFKQILASRE